MFYFTCKHGVKRSAQVQYNYNTITQKNSCIAAVSTSALQLQIAIQENYSCIAVVLHLCVPLKPNTHRRRRRNSTVELSCVGGVYAVVGCRDPVTNSAASWIELGHRHDRHVTRDAARLCASVIIGVSCVTFSFAFGKIGKMRLNRKQTKRVAAKACNSYVTSVTQACTFWKNSQLDFVVGKFVQTRRN